MASLSVAVIGAGNIATQLHLPLLSAKSDVRLEHLIEPDQKRGQEAVERFAVPYWHRSVDDFLEHASGVDCVFVLTPPYTHPPLVSRFVAAGLDVFCEKPVAERWEDVVGLQNSVKGTDRILGFGFNRRFAPVVRAAKRLFESRELVFCHASKSRAMQYPRCLVENSIHAIDQLTWFAGSDPVSVVGHGDAFDEVGIVERRASVSIAFKNGVLGSFHTVRQGGGYIERAELYGADFTAVVEIPDRLSIYRDEGPPPKVPLEGVRQVKEGVYEPTGDDSLGFEAELDHYFECVRTRSTPLINLDSAVRTHRLVDMIYESCRLLKPGAPEEKAVRDFGLRTA